MIYICNFINNINNKDNIITINDIIKYFILPSNKWISINYINNNIFETKINQMLNIDSDYIICNNLLQLFQNNIDDEESIKINGINYF